MKILSIYANRQLNLNNQGIYPPKVVNSIIQDDFIGLTKNLQQQQFNPAFGAIFEDEAIKFCDFLLKEAVQIEDCEQRAMFMTKSYIQEKGRWMTLAAKISKEEENLTEFFVHVVSGNLQSKVNSFIKNENNLREFVEEIRLCVKNFQNPEYLKSVVNFGK